MQAFDLVSEENLISDQFPNLEIVIQEQRDRPNWVLEASLGVFFLKIQEGSRGKKLQTSISLS